MVDCVSDIQICGYWRIAVVGGNNLERSSEGEEEKRERGRERGGVE